MGGKLFSKKASEKGKKNPFQSVAGGSRLCGVSGGTQNPNQKGGGEKDLMDGGRGKGRGGFLVNFRGRGWSWGGDIQG